MFTWNRTDQYKDALHKFCYTIPAQTAWICSQNSRCTRSHTHSSLHSFCLHTDAHTPTNIQKSASRHSFTCYLWFNVGRRTGIKEQIHPQTQTLWHTHFPSACVPCCWIFVTKQLTVRAFKMCSLNWISLKSARHIFTALFLTTFLIFHIPVEKGDPTPQSFHVSSLLFSSWQALNARPPHLPVCGLFYHRGTSFLPALPGSFTLNEASPIN